MFCSKKRLHFGRCLEIFALKLWVVDQIRLVEVSLKAEVTCGVRTEYDWGPDGIQLGSGWNATGVRTEHDLGGNI